MPRILAVSALSLLLSLPVVAASPAAEKAGTAAAPKNTTTATTADGKQVEMIAATGKVLETMNSGGYSYIQLEEKGGAKKWFAVPETNVKKGEEISVQPGVEMTNFNSKTLGKTFDVIIFSSGVAGKQTAATAKGTPNPPAGDTKVTKATGPGAYTVAEIHAKRKALHGKQVTVRGRVTKVSSGIMKRNWIHLEDGTGSAKKKTNTVVVTSATEAAMGEVITIKGTLASDKDFGAGYKYAVIIENASITRK